MQVVTERADILLSQEVYAHSLSAIRAMGAVAVRGLERIEENAFFERGWNDFYTSVEENLTTDSEYGEELAFAPFQKRPIIDSAVRTETGESIFSMVLSGARESKKAALYDPKMSVQAVRDEGDVLVAGWVDKLEIGEMLTVVSMDPKEAIAEDKAFWEEKMGYRDGMAVIQTYYRSSESELLSGVHSVKRSSKKAMARAMAEAGTTIPEDTSSDLWSRYPIRKNGVVLEEAQQFGRSLRTRHKELLQDEALEISTTAFLQDNTEIVRNYFDAYIIPLAEACFSGINNEQMRTLAGTISMCAKSIELSTQVRLQRIATGMDFTNEDAVLMESMIRYALVEELRKKLPEYISRQHASEEVHSYEVTHIMAPPGRRHINFRCYDYDMHAMNMRTARNINGGVQAGRSYGGCSVASPKAKSYGEDSDVPKKQDVFGGVTNQDEEGGDEEDKFGSLRFQCKKGHWNTRPRNKLIPKCKTCGDSVKC